MPHDTEALKALVAIIKSDNHINGDVALTECRKALPALERLLAFPDVHPAPSVATEEQRPVAYGMEYMGELLPETVNISRDRVSDDIADRDQKYPEYADKRKLVALYSSPSPSQDAIMGAAREIQKWMYRNDGITDWDEETEEFSPSKDREEIAAILIKHLGPVKHETEAK